MYLLNMTNATDVSFFSCVPIKQRYVALETGVSTRETDVSDPFLRPSRADARVFAAPEAPPAVPARTRCGLGCAPTRATAFRGAGRSRSGRCRSHAGPAAHRMRQALLEALTIRHDARSTLLTRRIRFMSFQARPISFKPPRLNGLSGRLIASHYENNYGGAVRRLNAIAEELAAHDPAALPSFRLNGLKREELIASNSMLLHEVYFDSLGEGGGGDPDGALAEAIARDFGSLARWRGEFVAMGKALGGGSGWVVLTRSPRDGRLCNVWSADHTHSLAGGTPVLALDMYEHSYHLDFGSNAAGYDDAFMANIAWGSIANRFAGRAAEPRSHMIDAPTAKAMLDADPE